MTSVPLPSAVSVPTTGSRQIDVDLVLSDSFPASDPPSWTSGIAETVPSAVPLIDIEPLGRLEGSPAWLRTLASTGGAVLLVLGFPILVLLIPLALAWRLVLEISGWPHRPATS